MGLTLGVSISDQLSACPLPHLAPSSGTLTHCPKESRKLSQKHRVCLTGGGGAGLRPEEAGLIFDFYSKQYSHPPVPSPLEIMKEMGARGTAQWITCLLFKWEDLSLGPQHPCKNPESVR